MTVVIFFFFQAEDGIRDLVRSRGLGDVYKRQAAEMPSANVSPPSGVTGTFMKKLMLEERSRLDRPCLLYTSDAADERSSVDLGGRRIIKKKTNTHARGVIIMTKRLYCTITAVTKSTENHK